MAVNVNTLPNASFKNFDFFWSGHIINNIGRRTVVHEFPDRPHPATFVEDLGSLGEKFTLDAILMDYSDSFSNRDSFLDLLNEPGSGRLVLPTYPPREVYVTSVTMSDSSSAIGASKFNITFQSTEENKYPEILQGNKGLISKLKDETLDKNDSVFSSTITKINDYRQKYSSFKSNVIDSINSNQAVRLIKSGNNFIRSGKTAGGIRALASKISGAGDGFAAFTNSLNDIVLSVDQLIQSPALLAQSFRNSFANLEDSYDNAKDLFDSLSNMFGFLGSDDSIIGDSNIQEDKRTNQTALNNYISITALVTAYEAASQVDYTNTEEVNEVMDSLENGFLALDQDLDTELYQSILSLRSETTQFLISQKEQLPRVIQLDVVNSIPLAVLVYQVYGSLDRIDEIYSLNNFEDPASISGTVKILIV